MKVKFVPQNIELEIQTGQTVKNLADTNGIFIKSVCKGIPSCSECRVRVVEGDYNVLPPGTKELNLIGTGYFIDQRRLSCQLVCFGDITVDMTEQLAKENSQQARKPQGSKKSEEEVTHAVTGNLLNQDDGIKELLKVAQTENNRDQSGRHQQRQGGGQQQKQGQQRHQQQRGSANQRNNQNNQSNQGNRNSGNKLNNNSNNNRGRDNKGNRPK